MAKNFKNTFLFVGILILLVSSFYSCSTKRNTFARRVYHNLNSHYNSYWNGKESLEKAQKFIEDNAVENYNEILPVFNYGTSEQVSSMSADLDRAQEKAAKAIQKHSMRFKGKEYVRWIDDSYLVIGQAYFYKLELVSARRTFNFIIQNYPESDLRFDAMLWLARTYNRNEEFEKSENLLLELQSINETEVIPFRVQQELPLLFADLYCLQDRHEIAVDYIVQAIERSSKRKLITRLKFILAQIYLDQEKYSEAADLFKEVIRRNPDFRMAFQSRLNLALAFDDQNPETIQRLLKRMLSDVGNEEFLDQIYYALAELSLKFDDYNQAIEYLKKSVSQSVNNDYQKTKSAYTLGNLRYAERSYVESGLYYDTSSQSIPEFYPNYDSIKPMLETMISLTGHLQTVQEQDSLRRVAALSEEERNVLIDEMIAIYQADEIKRSEEERIRMENMQSRLPQTNFAEQASSTSWYFYNPSTISYGKAQFLSKWGRRKLEDNWRLSRKQILTDDNFLASQEEETTSEVELSSDSTGVQSNKLSRSYYLQNLPLSPEKLKQSDEKIIEALYSAGVLFKESLNDKPNAFDTFGDLLSRYPQNPYILQTYYHLYKLSLDLNKITETNYYKSKILNEFPGSNYAKIVADPQYFIKMSQQQSESSEFYTEVYEAYKNEQYFLVIDLCEKALANFNDTILVPKFDYLKALSEGRIGTYGDFVTNLERIISAYPHSEIKPLAEQVYATLTQEKTDSETVKKENLKSIYSFSDDTFHNYILIVKSGSVNLDALKVRLSDFNRKYSRRQRFAISSFELDDKHDLVTVSRFKNAALAEKYLKAIIDEQYVLSIFKSEEDYKQLVISNSNYLLFYKDKNIEDYIEFYNIYYELNENSN